MIKHKQNRISTYNPCKRADFEQISLKRCDVIISHNRLYYDYLPLVSQYEQKAIWRQTQRGYKQKPLLEPVNKMMSTLTPESTAEERRVYFEALRARSAFRKTLTPEEQTLLNRGTRWTPDEAEALLYQMDEEVLTARRGFEGDSEDFGNSENFESHTRQEVYVYSNGFHVISRYSMLCGGVEVLDDLGNYGFDEGKTYDKAKDDLKQDRKRYDALEGTDTRLNIKGATPYYRKLIRWLESTDYWLNPNVPDVQESYFALRFIWNRHLHNIEKHAKYSLDTVTAKDAQIDNSGRDYLQATKYHAKVRALAREKLPYLYKWAHSVGFLKPDEKGLLEGTLKPDYAV